MEYLKPICSLEWHSEKKTQIHWNSSPGYYLHFQIIYALILSTHLDRYHNHINISSLYSTQSYITKKLLSKFLILLSTNSQKNILRIIRVTPSPRSYLNNRSLYCHRIILERRYKESRVFQNIRSSSSVGKNYKNHT